MARITVEDCLEKIDNQYDLVLLAKERTSQLNAGSQMLVEEDLEKSAITRLRKEPDEQAQQEETEDDENDDFENLYKGQISKSGIAILPSKRSRKIPEIKKPSLADEALTELKAEQPVIREEALEPDDTPLELKEEVAPEEEKKPE